MASRRTIFCLLTACAVIELLLFFSFYSLGPKAFREFVWSADTSGYDRIALRLVEHGSLISSSRTLGYPSNSRTLGYPLFLSLGYLIGGRSFGIYAIIAVQLILNIIITWGCWKLMERIVPSVGIRLRAITTLIFFFAGLGMAFSVMADFLAAFFFGVFLYGMLFWRTSLSVVLSGTSLALATLTRPTFTLVPFILPIAAYLVRQITSRTPWSHILVFTIFSMAATSISITYQYMIDGYFGPSPVLTQNFQRIIYFALMEGHMTENEYIGEFEAEIAKRGGREFIRLSRGDQEKYAKQMFLEVLISNPGQVLFVLFKNFVKYLFSPIEFVIARLVLLNASEYTYTAYIRPIIGLLCLPIWVFSLTPPIGSPRKYKMYYIFAMVFLFYVLGISAITPWQGERMRFPVLAFMLPVMVWNVRGLFGYLSQWLGTSSDKSMISEQHERRPGTL